MRFPCPACDLLFDDDLDSCPLCGREPPRGVRDPGPAADGGAST